jgi:hypothetical protein
MGRVIDRELVGTLARFLLLLAVFAAPWPGLPEATGHTANSISRALASLDGIDAEITVSSRYDEAWTAMISVVLPDAPPEMRVVRFPIALRRTLFLPVVTFAAGLLAVRVWRRRDAIRAVALALALLTVVVCLSVVVPVLVVCNESERIRLPRLLGDVMFAYLHIIASPSLAYALPAGLCFGTLYLTRARECAA